MQNMKSLRKLATMHQQSRKGSACMLTDAQLAFSTACSLRFSILWNGSIHSKDESSTSINISKKIPYRCSQRLTFMETVLHGCTRKLQSWEIPYCVSLTALIIVPSDGLLFCLIPIELLKTDFSLGLQLIKKHHKETINYKSLTYSLGLPH